MRDTRPGKRLQFASENCHLEIVDLPIENGDFPVRDVNVYQRVTFHNPPLYLV
jgi:hypothetical protein